MNNLACPYCEDTLDLNLDEPGEWCKDENIPDGDWRINCGSCKEEVVIISSWSPNFDAIRTEDY